MRLHRIEVQNLNSLQGSHTVDLDRDLGGASLFLILGPTGAGKSTLMDAVSLALFGRTPRLEAHRADRDVADAIMSRGSGEARAQVEFSKLDGATGERLRFRATWATHRARQRADGVIQSVRRGIERLERDGSWTVLADDPRAKFYEPEFAKVLEGFTSADFQRSMLLAQGRFDAMLHAEPGARAAILERLTDTGIYQELGLKAAELRRSWDIRLNRLIDQVKAFSTLSPDSVRLARADASRLAGWLAGVARWQSVARAAREWLLRRDELARDLAAAEAGAAAASQALADRAPDLAALAAHERCLPVFGALDAQRDAGHERARLAQLLADLEGALPGLAARVDSSGAQRDRDAQQAAAAEADLHLLADVVGPAEQAALAVQRAAAERGAAAVAAAKAQQEKAQADQAAADAGAALAAAAIAADLAAGNLALGATDKLVAGALPDLEPRTHRWLQASAAATQAAQQLLQRSARAAEASEKLSAERADLEARRAIDARARQQLVDDAHAALQALHGNAGRAPDFPQAASAQLERLRGRQGQVAVVEALARPWARATAELREREADAAKRQADAQADRRALDVQVLAEEAARRHQVTCEARVRLAERLVRHLVDRQKLEPGQPCPVCGSTSHPAVEHPPDDTAEPAPREELALAQADLDRSIEQLQDNRARREAAGQKLAAAEAGRLALQAEVARAEAAVLVAREPLDAAVAVLSQPAPGVPLLQPEDGPAGLPAYRQLLADAIAQLDRKMADDQRLMQALDAARAAQTEGAVVLDREAAGLANQEHGLSGALGELALARVEIDTEDRRVQQARNELRASYAEVDIGPGGDPDSWLRQAQEAAGRWESLVAAQVAADAERQRQDSELQAAVAQRALRDGAANDAVTALRGREAAEQDAKKAAAAAELLLRETWRAIRRNDPPDRARPADDATPALLHQDQRALVAQLRLAAAGSRDAADSDRTRLDQANGRKDELTAALVLQADRLADATAQLSAALVALDLPDADAARALRLEPARRNELIAERTRLHDALIHATATAKAAQTLRDRHQLTRPDDLDADPDAAQLDDLMASLDTEAAALAPRLDAARALVAIQDRDTAARAAAQARLDVARQEAGVWLTLHSLIGVGDGERFKQFAQALNLGALLRRANLHLERLSDRYRLIPRPDPETGLPTLEFDLDDRWRPGQPRSPRTLSGGESFLVSLALALGLSDLRTSRLPIETLLLDEGFGTLDPASLDVAMAALQQLQASGRQVGIISHVAGLHERVPARIRIVPEGEGRSRIQVELD